MKKFISLIMAAVICLSCASVIFADETSGNCGSNARWTYDIGSKTITISGSGAIADVGKASAQPWKKYSMQAEKVEIYQGITAIGNNAFKGFDSLKSVSIPSSVTSIGNYAFSGCTDLSDITIPSSVKNIGEYAFEHCFKITSVSIPSGITEIKKGTFSTCSALESVTIPSTVTAIGAEAFKSCKALKKVDIPASVKTIGANAFDTCTALEEVNMKPKGNLETIGERAFSDCTSLKAVSIPATTSKIGDYAFFNCKKLKEITFNTPSRLKWIGDFAFSKTKAETVSVPSGTEHIGEGAFYACSSLKSLYIPSSTSSIGEGITNECTAIETVKVGNVEISGDNAGGMAGYSVDQDAVVVSGKDQKYKIGDGGLTITVNNKDKCLTKADFSGVTIESSGKFKSVDSKYVKVEEGIKVTVDDGFLSTLQNGVHTVYVATKSGVASTDFTLSGANESLADIFGESEETDNPNTGAPVLVMPALVSVISAAALVIRKK